MRLVLVVAVVVPVIVAAVFAVFFIQSIESPGTDISQGDDQTKWQLYQKTYLEQECREKYIGQPAELEKCYDRIDEEQRLNPPTISP